MNAPAETTMRPFSLAIERPLRLARNHEAAVLRAAVDTGAAAPAIHEKLATLLFIQDHFDEAIALLEPLVAARHSFTAARTLAECHISRETDADNELAAEAARIALSLAEHDDERAIALAALGKALRRMGRIAEARVALVDALTADPGSIDAYKRLAAIDLEAGDTDAILEIADTLISKGVGHSRLQVARVIALARTGRIDEARDAAGLDRFLYREILPPPPGWPTIEAFNADVKAELYRHPDIRYDRYGTASHKTWRIDQPAIEGSTTIPALQESIQRAVTAYVATLGRFDTPWTRARPANAVLHNWCVMTDADGFEEWHVHQNGWLSGVYYADVPPTVTSGDGPGGCIAFGLPDDQVGPEVAALWGEQQIRPQPGLLMLFPSHTFHRTYPHGSDHRRICLAFDIWSADPAGS